MRNEVLHGYLIHHRKYRERSHIVHLFTQEHGRVDWIFQANATATISANLCASIG